MAGGLCSEQIPGRAGYLINVASAKNGVGYGQWIHIDGWSDKVLDYIVKWEQSQKYWNDSEPSVAF